MTATKKVLLLSDSERVRMIEPVLNARGYSTITADSTQVLSSLCDDPSLYFAICDLRWRQKNMLTVLQSLRGPVRWVVLLPEGCEENNETLRLAGATATMPHDFSARELDEVLGRVENCLRDPMYEVMDTLESISGVQLKKDKRSLVESRLLKRLAALKITSFDEYACYFLENREREIPQALSLVTTHTTEFFREEAHFDFLFEKVFPVLFSSQKKKIVIWSAAASTGQEVYSLAISILEYIRSSGLKRETCPAIEVHGTDIDVASLEVAREGIYKRDQIEALPAEMVADYFDEGQEDLAGYVRVKDEVHSLCRFSRLNLMTDKFQVTDADVIFLRNALIYFKPSDVAAIVTNLATNMTEQGLLFLGHSESLAGLSTTYQKVGNSIYTNANRSLFVVREPEIVASVTTSRGKVEISKINELIVIGSSTGGVEALKVLLQDLPMGCPPVLIVQHIPAGFSLALAKRLNAECAIEIREAVDGEEIAPSHVYIAPGGKQMRLRRTGTVFKIEITDDAPLGLHKPSVDYLFQSIVPMVRKIHVAAALLTGMGSDGAKGLKALRNAGAHTIAQDEKTSVVFGMPGAAVELDAADEVLPLPEIATQLLRKTTGRGHAA